MEIAWILIAAAGGILAGGIPLWLMGRSQRRMLSEQLAATQQELSEARANLGQMHEKISGLNQSIVRLETTLDHERRASGEKTAILDNATQKLRDAFQSLSAEAL